METSVYPKIIHLYPSTTAERPDAHAVLTVKEGPNNLYLTLRLPAVILDRIWSILSLLIFL